jgi:nitrite reductase/ring-hydroxylating ferredoxin subunit
MRNYALIMIAVAMLTSCGKDANYIPNVYVNYHISLPEFQIKKNAGGVLLVSGQGVAGLIIYQRADGAYLAFDRCSSVNPEQKCAIVPDESGLTATDPCSGSKFSLYDGSPVKAPATRTLKKYSVSVSSFELSVNN